MTPMIFRFAVDPEALVDAQTGGTVDVALRAAHERVIDCWSDFGILVLEGPNAQARTLIEAVQSLPEELRTMWEKALKKNRVFKGGPDWLGLGNVHQLSDLDQAPRFIDLACFSEEKASTLLEPDQWSVFPQPSLEVCRFGYLDRSETFLQSKTLAHGSIEKGASIETVWKRRFSPLARVYRNVCLIDRYALSSHRYCKEERATKSGLEFLIEKLGTGSRPSKLRIVTATNDEYSKEFAGSMLKRIAGNPKYEQLKEVILFIADDSLFRRFVHYRSIRFGRVFCQLDTGLEVLEGPRVKRTCNFHVMAQTSALDREEAMITTEAHMDVICRRPMKIKPAEIGQSQIGLTTGKQDREI